MKSGIETLRKMLEQEHSKAQCDRIVTFVGNDPGKFTLLVEVFLEGPYRITQRAAWPLSYAAIANPTLVRRHLPKLVKMLGTKGVHDGVKRNVLRLLPHVDIPESLHEKLIAACFEFLTNRKEPVAVHVFAMEVLAKLVARYPELKRELALILEDELPYSSPGYKSRALKILRKLESPV